FSPEAKGHGVPEVMEAIALRNGRIRPRVVLGRAVASSICIGSGGSVGREGPIAQIGAAIGSTFGQILKVRPRRMRTMVGCGAAAGIAAAFNAPVAGALFAVEIILGDFGVHQFSPIVISSVMATVVSRHFLGNLPAFSIPAYSLHHPYELGAYAILGLLAGITALLFIRTIDVSEDFFDSLRFSAPLKGMLGGMCVGGIGLLLPGAMGVGYEQINVVLTQNPTALFLAALLVAKLVAVGITIGSGGSGGIFVPSLFLGAMVGGEIGLLMNHIFPGAVGSPGAYALVGMGAVVSSATHAPITAILILFELTNDYHIILPLMISCTLGTLVASRLLPQSIYTIKLARRGIRIHQGQDVNVLRKVRVKEVMDSDVPVISPRTPLLQILNQAVKETVQIFYVAEQDGRLLGILTMNELQPLLRDADMLQTLVTAEDLASGNFPKVAPEDTLDRVIQQLDLGYRDELPVLEDGRLAGRVRIDKVLNRYRTELFKHDMAEEMAETLPAVEEHAVLRRVGNFVVAEVEAPVGFYGRTLVELDVRNRFGPTVLLVKPSTPEGRENPVMPQAKTRIEPGDRLLLFGTGEQIRRLQGA
ncbi:MAG: chloride channel protein, partial [Planctomycetota bacterium]